MSCFLQPFSLFKTSNRHQVLRSYFWRKKLYSSSTDTKYVVDVPVSTSLRASIDISLLRKQLETGTVLFDFPQFSYFRITGSDRLSFIHNMSSNHFLNSHPFQVRWTCFLTSTGRILDVALVAVLQDSLFVVSSIEKKQKLWEHFDRHIFPMDNVSVKEENYASFVWIGKHAREWVEDWCYERGMIGNQEPLKVFDDTHQPIYLVELSTLEPKWSGYLLLCSTQDIDRVQASIENFQNKGFLLFHMDKEHWECLRIEMGKGNVLKEWSEEYHPLQAGLWHMVSFQKGCYLGQETILRLKTYGGIKKYLVGWFLESPVEPFSYVYCQEKRIGIITSCQVIEKTTQLQDTIVIGLGYLQRDYIPSQYLIDESLEKIVSQPPQLPWDSTPFFCTASRQVSTPVKCIVRKIAFPVWQDNERANDETNK
ncbi:hypothetical protein GpartN1_g7671.t1 [Galdieria partita]|uniref:GCVT N-terminal domain-containing protein n=1 Tax=Galdieria partita TaxID=83374 RepID=A0A9C7UV09_9RHOD|nr:hypothetical protein GpartN1_g7671.t1 [Galdieria partita]